MNVRNPKVSVLMPVYNGEQYLRESIESILNQTFRDFEFLIISEHGTSDESLAIIQSYSDERIRHIHNTIRLGLVGSLNLGLKEAKGEYIARMDADDFSYSDRLANQVIFLNTHPETGIVGTSCKVVDKNGNDLGRNMEVPISDLHIRWVSLLACPFAHPTVMIRRDILRNNGLIYDEAFQWLEDYELWTRLLKYTKGANLNKPLVKYRVNKDSITGKYSEKQLIIHNIVALRTIREQLPEYAITSEDVTRLAKLLFSSLDENYSINAELYIDMLKTFINQNSKNYGLRFLKRQEALKLSLRIFSRSFQPGYIRVIKRLWTFDRSLPISFSVYLLTIMGRKLRKYT